MISRIQRLEKWLRGNRIFAYKTEVEAVLNDESATSIDSTYSAAKIEERISEIPSSGASTFLELTDTPDTFVGEANKFPKVNAGETALEFVTLAGGGDMLASVYDPTNVADDAFDVDNHVSGTTNKVYTATEQSKLSGIETGAQVNIIEAVVDDLTPKLGGNLDADDKILNKVSAIYGDAGLITHVELSVAEGTHVGYDNAGVGTHTIWTGGTIQNKVDDADILTIDADGVTINGDVTADNLGTAAAKNIPVSGDASATEVVYGTDTRLTNARTPSAHTHTESEITDLDHTDTDAIHDNVDSEFLAITEKTAVVGGDLVLIEDSEHIINPYFKASAQFKNFPISTATQGALDAKANDADVVHDTGNETVAGVKTFSSDPLIPDEAYGSGWNNVLEPPTKNAVYDKIELLPTQLIVPISAAPLTIANQANSEQFFGNVFGYITKADLTKYTQVRLIVNVLTASTSANTPRLYLEYYTSYSETVGDYLDIGASAVNCTLASTGLKDSGWINLVAGAKADVIIAVLQNGGDADKDPRVGHVLVHFR